MSAGLDFSNKNFQTASSFILYTQENVFLTGKAGTGKTTFLKYIKDRCNKKYILTAPTGVAAINAGGVTLHSFFQLPIGTFIADYKKNWGVQEEQFIVNRHQMFSKLRIGHAKRKLIKEMELLIIDEISMVRADTLDAVDEIMRHIRMRPNDPFGGVQLLFIGDLYQLPPVVRRDELAIMNEYYRSLFFFDSHALQDNKPVCIELDKIYRQDDSAFITVLNNIRNNDVQEEDLELLHSRYFPNYNSTGEDGIITLTSHNAQADELNQFELAKLTTKEKVLKANVTGEFPDNAFPMESDLILKEGAQVMFIKNDKGEQRRFYNGKIGTVRRIDSIDKEIEVYFPKEKNSITINPEVWENIRYKLNEEKNVIEEDVIGKFEQFPFRLAWAVTIHKSQGLTFDEAVIDAGRSFAPGQVYVALSRMTSLNGMILKSKIAPNNILVDDRIKEFMSGIKGADAWEEKLAYGQKVFLLNSLMNAFQWTTFIERIEEYLETSVSILTQDLVKGSDIYRSSLLTWRNVEKVGTGFARQLYHIFLEKQYNHLFERVVAATEWMESNITSGSLTPLQAWHDTVKVEKGGAKVASVIKYLIKQVKMKIGDMKKFPNVIAYLEKEENFAGALEIWVGHNTTEEDNLLPSDVAEKATKVKGASAQISIDMFKKKMTIEEIAENRKMAPTTIVGHLATGVKDGSIPITGLVDDMKMIDIIDAKKKYPTETMTDIKARLQDTVSFDDIKLTMAYMEWLGQKME